MAAVYHSRSSSARQRLSIAAAVLLVLASVAGLFLWRTQSVRLLSVQSGSMSPAIEAGDAVLVRPIAEDELRIGDIVSFYSLLEPGIVVTHRVVSIDSTGQVTTRGDSNADEDPVLDPTMLVGRVERQVANAGYVIDFMRSRAGLALLIYMPAVTIIIVEIRRLALFFRPVYRHVSLIARTSR